VHDISVEEVSADVGKISTVSTKPKRTSFKVIPLPGDAGAASVPAALPTATPPSVPPNASAGNPVSTNISSLPVMQMLRYRRGAAIWQTSLDTRRRIERVVVSEGGMKERM
jgi:hypothetical protein